VSGKRMSNNI